MILIQEQLKLTLTMIITSDFDITSIGLPFKRQNRLILAKFKKLI